MGGIEGAPPDIPGLARYWITNRGRIHRNPACYTRRHELWPEWVAARGRSWESLDGEAEREGRVILWCLRCFPEADSRVRMGERPRWGRGWRGGSFRGRRGP